VVCDNMSVKKIYNWMIVQRYCDEGHSLAECLQQFGMSRLGLRKAVRRGELKVGPTFFADRRQKHDWAQIRADYESGKSVRECAKQFGFALESWSKAVRRGDVTPRPNGLPIGTLLSSGKRDRGNVKSRLLGAGLLENRCSTCGLTEWRGSRLAMHLDHVNGMPHDHRLKNLRMLCPNCHSQTPTYAGRNVRRDQTLQEPVRSV
jgi:5-methylcytosine-specific restriction endonuclease McrA